MKLLHVRLVFAIAIIATIGFFTVGTQKLRIETNLNDLNPEKINDAGMKLALETLTKDVSQRFVVVIKGSNNKVVSQASESLQRKLNALPALSVLSEGNVQKQYLNTLAPYRFNLLSAAQRDALASNSDAEIAKSAERRLYQLGNGVRVIPFIDDPLGWFSDFVLSQADTLDSNSGDEEGTPGQFVASFSVVFDQYPQNMAKQEALYRSVIAIENETESQYDVSILHSGMFFFAVDSAQSAKGDIQLIAVGSMLGVLVLMLLVFRSLLPLLLSIGSIVIGVGFGIFASTLVFGSVHVLTIVFGASLIGIVVDYSLHYFYHFLSHQHDKSARHHSSALIRAMVLSVLTSLIGYGALGLSDLLILKKVALFSCAGLLMAWLSVMILGPLVTKRPIDARQRMLRNIIRGCQAVFARQPRVLAAGGLFVACAATIFLIAGQPAVNDDPRRFFHVSPALLAQESDVASVTQVYEPGRYLLVEGESSDAIFTTLSTFYDALGEDSEAIFSVLDWLPSPSEQQENYALQQRLYKDEGVLDIFSAGLGLDDATVSQNKQAYRNAAQQSLGVPALLNELPSLPPLWVQTDGRIYSFALIRKNSNLAAIEQKSGQVANLSYVNTLAKASQALKAQRETGAWLLALAYALIALVLVIYYRTFHTLALLFIPLTASVVTLAAVSLMGQAITVFHVMALFLVLGLGMDYIIFAREMTGQRATTQQAILLSAVTSLLSFGLLAFSAMPIVQAFGSTILIGNTINFIAAISLFNERSQEKEKRPDVG